MYEASKAMKRRIAKGEIKYFKGNGLDIGCGPDIISKHKASIPEMQIVRGWDLADGDAQYLASVADGSYDFVHSSHCLEHMVNPTVALKNWVRVVKSGGYIVVTIPDEEMYEHNQWPSKYNNDHKWSFRVYQGNKKLPKSTMIFELLRNFWKDTEIISVVRLEDNYRWDLGPSVDQTGPADGPECAIEFILRKK